MSGMAELHRDREASVTDLSRHREVVDAARVMQAVADHVESAPGLRELPGVYHLTQISGAILQQFPHRCADCIVLYQKVGG